VFPGTSHRALFRHKPAVVSTNQQKNIKKSCISLNISVKIFMFPFVSFPFFGKMETCPGNKAKKIPRVASPGARKKD
jgi:hypothetical protein